MAIMRYMDLTDHPLIYLKGDLAYKSDNVIVFPQITQEREMPITVLTNQLVNATVINNKVVILSSAGGSYKLFYESTEHNLIQVNGLVVFGEKVFCFHQNKCLVIDTNTDNTKTITISAPTNIIYAYQINSFLFALITSNPTTIYIYSLNDAGNIANTGNNGSISLPSYSYATFSHPKQNVRLVSWEDNLYLIGTDATVVLSLDVQDLVYLRTIQTYHHPVSPFEELERTGFQFLTETLNFFVFRNTINNSTMWVSKGDEKIFFSVNTLYLTNSHAFRHNKLYTFSHIFDLALSDIPIYRFFNVKFKSNGLNGVLVNLLETSTDVDINMSILSRYYEAEKVFSYKISPDWHIYKTLLKGEEFLLEINSNKALRIAELKAW